MVLERCSVVMATGNPKTSLLGALGPVAQPSWPLSLHALVTGYPTSMMICGTWVPSAGEAVMSS